MSVPDMPLRQADLDFLERVTNRLHEAVRAHVQEPDNLFILDSVVKRFELTYELAIRNLTRFLADRAGSPQEVRSLSYQGLIRLADDLDLVRTGWPNWKRYRNARNRTVHEYYEESAREVAKDAGAFAEEATFLLTKLRKGASNNE